MTDLILMFLSGFLLSSMGYIVFEMLRNKRKDLQISLLQYDLRQIPWISHDINDLVDLKAERELFHKRRYDSRSEVMDRIAVYVLENRVEEMPVCLEVGADIYVALTDWGEFKKVYSPSGQPYLYWAKYLVYLKLRKPDLEKVETPMVKSINE